VSDELVQERARRGAARVYADDRIEVLWEPALCIHVKSCVRGLPEVFDAQSRPWIHVEAADADRIAETVATCPTGALHFRRLDGGAEEDAPEETVVRATRNGPLFLRGRVRINDADGNLLREDTRVALCRCGGSANKPFCDGTHNRIGFDSGA
jgi:uncharacterized Fe-S cluster protein YjdI